jgi:hypothetical protein
MYISTMNEDFLASSSSALARPALSLCGIHSAAHHADNARIKISSKQQFVMLI